MHTHVVLMLSIYPVLHPINFGVICSNSVNDSFGGSKGGPWSRGEVRNSCEGWGLCLGRHKIPTLWQSAIIKHRRWLLKHQCHWLFASFNNDFNCGFRTKSALNHSLKKKIIRKIEIVSLGIILWQSEHVQ